MSLLVYQSLWAMEDLPRGEPVQWTLAQRVGRIAEAGFHGLSVDLGARQVPEATDLAAELRGSRLRAAVNAFVSDEASMDDALRYADTIGAPLIVVCAQVFSLDFGFLADTVHRWHARAAAAGVEVQLETHRGTMTNDLRATVALLDYLNPDVLLAADLSHYVCGCELPDKPTPEIESLMDAILGRSVSMQGRVATRCQVQIPLGHVDHQLWVARFRDWWTRGFASMAARGLADPMFCAELGTRPYAPTGPDGRELSDRWAEALVLRDWARECYEAAVPAAARLAGGLILTTTSSVPVSPSPVAAGPLDGRPVGDSILPVVAYTGQAEFDLERERVFAAGWAWVGFEHWISQAGDVLPVTIAGRPLLLVRDHAGAVAAFHNVCRHRGMKLIDTPLTGQRRLRCDYHCWAYSLSGSLETTPLYGRTGLPGTSTEPTAEERAELSLLPVASATWAGLIFVNLAEEPTSFTTQIEPLIKRWAGVDFGRLSLAGERRYDIEGNWKLAVENFLDFYHLPFVHPQIGSASVTLDIDDLPLTPDIIGGCYPRGAESKADKTDMRLPPFGDIGATFGGRQELYCVFPNVLIFLEAGWFQVIGVVPVAPDRTIEHIAVFVDRDAGGDAFEGSRKLLCDSLFEINDQDVPILRRLQEGRNSPAANRNFLLPHWDQVTAHFQQRVRHAIAVGE